MGNAIISRRGEANNFIIVNAPVLGNNPISNDGTPYILTLSSDLFTPNKSGVYNFILIYSNLTINVSFYYENNVATHVDPYMIAYESTYDISGGSSPDYSLPINDYVGNLISNGTFISGIGYFTPYVEGGN